VVAAGQKNAHAHQSATIAGPLSGSAPELLLKTLPPKIYAGFKVVVDHRGREPRLQ